jgi:hypothetical protein
MTAIGTILMVGGALRLAASLAAADTSERRSALYYLAIGAVTTASQL